MPAVAIVTQPFLGIARTQARLLGLEPARVVAIEHPLDGLEPDAVGQRAEAAIEAVVAHLLE
ncbi:MAG TPA: hypothetical protein VFD01_12870 [Candidatus Dormibacteraeota bacterium]|jgi:hypothetical protein|nr:hypothetical protein [Candidatus Dormibacteraeota bacterium]